MYFVVVQFEIKFTGQESAKKFSYLGNCIEMSKLSQPRGLQNGLLKCKIYMNCGQTNINLFG